MADTKGSALTTDTALGGSDYNIGVQDVGGTPSTVKYAAKLFFNMRVGSTASSATPTINTDIYEAYSITAQAADITSFTTNLSGTPVNFQRLIIRIKDDDSSRAITWGTSFQSGTATVPTTTTVGKTLMVGFIYDSVDSKWTCEATGSRACRGCYYRKCAFCNLHLDHRNFRLRQPELLLEDIRKLSQKYNTPYFFFTDESDPMNHLREISQGIIKNQWDIKWMGGVRFESALTGDVLAKMRESGCQKLVFGLESYNQRMLGLMKKGTKVDVVKKVLDECLKAGISFHLYIIIGFPPETQNEALETIGFVLNKEYLDSPKSLNTFAPRMASPVTTPQ